MHAAICIFHPEQKDRSMLIPFGTRLKQLREQFDLTQTELADRSGVERSVIAKLESGKRMGVRAQTLRQLARAFNLTMDAFAEGVSLGEPDAPLK